MGSQTLEILRQGVWASLTGGWYYDPHHDVFCNTFHLYLWLFLLCTPFTIYLYIPPSFTIWCGYCTSVAVLFTIFKGINFSLHDMFDKPGCVVEEAPDVKDVRNHQPHHSDQMTSPNQEDEGIEMQVLNRKRVSSYTPECSPPPSSYGGSNDLPSTQQMSSTMDLKVDVHRKNSSESSEGAYSSSFVRKDSVASERLSSERWVGAGSTHSSQVSLHRHLSGAKSLSGVLEGVEMADNKDTTSERAVHHRPRKRRPRPNMSSCRSSVGDTGVDETVEDFHTPTSADFDWLFHQTDSETERPNPHCGGLWTVSDGTVSDTSVSLIDRPTGEEEACASTSYDQGTITKTPSSPVVGEGRVFERKRCKKNRNRQPRPSRSHHGMSDRGRPDDVNNNSSRKSELSTLLPTSSWQPTPLSSSTPTTRLSPVLPVVPSFSSAANCTLHSLSQGPGGTFVIQSHVPRVAPTAATNLLPSRLMCGIGIPLGGTLPLSGVLGSLQPGSSTMPSLGGVGPPLALGAPPQSDPRTAFVDSLRASPRPPPRYYRYPWCPGVKIHFDRLALLAVFDRNLTWFEGVLSVVLAWSVAALGAAMLHLGLYHDFLAFHLCFIMASSQYCLLKSVQPDTASPTHGYNRVVVFSRPIYFVIISSLLLLLHLNTPETCMNFTLFGFSLCWKTMASGARDLLAIVLLFFPLLFAFGLFPQINTFVMYLLEQVDMHIFGGNATCSVWSAFYCVLRSCLAVIFLYGFAYGGLTEEKSSQHLLFSIYCGLLVATSYHLSRSSSDPTPIINILKVHLWTVEEEATGETSKHNNNSPENNGSNGASGGNTEEPEKVEEDPLPRKLQTTVNTRLKSDLLVCMVIAMFIFAIHSSNVFTALQPELNPVIGSVAVGLGFVLHYLVPQMRKQLPWLCLARPLLVNTPVTSRNQFDLPHPPDVMWFEKLYVWLCKAESGVVYPVLILGRLASDTEPLNQRWGPAVAALVITVASLKALRTAFSQPEDQYLVLVFAVLFFQVDCPRYSYGFFIDYFTTAILFSKLYEFLLKVQFVVTYIAPWQITWGSAFHAFAQPFSVPHSALTFLQAAISAVLSSPLNPFLGSAIFMCSYVRPVKFWERDYNTRRVDHSNTRLCSHLDRNLGADDNNLNSIFYEHLTRSLQHSLCGDIILGRWGLVRQGDCFVLASDYLNCLVHIIELGNGLVTFQMRGLEFRGTYCQQREVEAISEGVEDNQGWCCCEPGHLPHLLSLNASFSQRWLAWQVTAASYILEGYSITDNSALSMLQVFDFRKVLVTYYVKSIIYYAVGSERVDKWLESSVIVEALKPTRAKSFVELDPIFNLNIDEDYDLRAAGITRASFCSVYLDWIQFCNEKRQQKINDCSKDSNLVSLCFALSLIGRRTLGAASHNTLSSVEFFLYGLHALFKGDFRITSLRDEWIFSDMELLKSVVAPAVRMSLKLHQNHFMEPEEYDDAEALHAAITEHREKLVISHEGDPAWRAAVLAGTPSLLALRHVTDEGTDDYKIIMLNKRLLSFRVIKVNRECVRGLWAGQQQELVYLRNTNPERGSIQNAKQALRNIINSSCDQPIGYPIFVSPLTTSYADTNEQLRTIVPGPITTSSIKEFIVNSWTRVKRRCVEGCSSGGSMHHDDGGFGNDGSYAMTTYNRHSAISAGISGSLERGGARASVASSGKPSIASLANLLSPSTHGSDSTLHRVRIIDANQVYDCINLGRRIDVVWPDERMRSVGGRSHWGDWVPLPGMEGQVVHKWVPCHRDINRRSHVDRTILLVKIEERYVPIAETGVMDLGPDI